MASIQKPSVYRVSVVQVGVLLPLCWLLSWLDKTAALSAFLGGLLCVLPHAYFASYAFRYTGARSAPLITRAFYRGEVGKFLLSAVGFAAVFSMIKPLNLKAIFLTYAVMLLVQWGIAARLVASRAVH